MSKDKIKIGGNGIELEGDIANDARPVVIQASELGALILRTLSDLIAIPSDFLHHGVNKLRNKYYSEIEKIPPNKRKIPNEREGALILREALYCGDEDLLKDMFAKLLATASHKDKFKSVHPGFPSIINGLSSIDAKILIVINKNKSFNLQLITNELNIDEDTLSIAISNLLRLGLLETDLNYYADPTISMINKPIFRVATSRQSHNQAIESQQKEIENLESTVRKLASRKVNKDVIISPLGKAFLESCT